VTAPLTLIHWILIYPVTYAPIIGYPLGGPGQIQLCMGTYPGGGRKEEGLVYKSLAPQGNLGGFV